jgi:hypothetical protein
VLDEWTRDKREAAARAGLPVPEYTGIELNVRGEGKFGGYKIWFYQIPGFNLYMMIVSGYEPLTQQPYCGYLSLSCPSVFFPIPACLPIPFSMLFSFFVLGEERLKSCCRSDTFCEAPVWY